MLLNKLKQSTERPKQPKRQISQADISSFVSPQENLCEQHSESESCPSCSGKEFWQPIGNDDRWLCSACSPPPSPVYVAKTRGPGLEIVKECEPVVVCYPWQVCPQCCGKWIRETFGIHGRMACWSCGAAVSSEDVYSNQQKITGTLLDVRPCFAKNNFSDGSMIDRKILSD